METSPLPHKGLQNSPRVTTSLCELQFFVFHRKRVRLLVGLASFEWIEKPANNIHNPLLLTFAAREMASRDKCFDQLKDFGQEKKVSSRFAVLLTMYMKVCFSWSQGKRLHVLALVMSCETRYPRGSGGLASHCAI